MFLSRFAQSFREIHHKRARRPKMGALLSLRIHDFPSYRPRDHLQSIVIRGQAGYGSYLAAARVTSYRV